MSATIVYIIRIRASPPPPPGLLTTNYKAMSSPEDLVRPVLLSIIAFFYNVLSFLRRGRKSFTTTDVDIELGDATSIVVIPGTSYISSIKCT